MSYEQIKWIEVKFSTQNCESDKTWNNACPAKINRSQGNRIVWICTPLEWLTTYLWVIYLVTIDSPFSYTVVAHTKLDHWWAPFLWRIRLDILCIRLCFVCLFNIVGNVKFSDISAEVVSDRTYYTCIAFSESIWRPSIEALGKMKSHSSLTHTPSNLTRLHMNGYGCKYTTYMYVYS